MFVKAYNSAAGRRWVFECYNEVQWAQKVELMDEAAVQAWSQSQEGLGFEPRTMIAWPPNSAGARVAVVEIYIPVANGKPIMFLTNVDVWLQNDRGRSVERINRWAGHVVEQP